MLALLRRPADAEEVLQETARVCWEKIDRYQPNTEFRAWACRIAHFKALEFRKRAKKAPLSFSDLFFERVDEEAVVMADQLDARMAALTDCLEKLSAGQREIVSLRYAPGATAKSVAAALARSTHAVYRELTRIHELLSRCIDRAVERERAP